MGKKKIEIKRIENSRMRNITFKKRCEGILKKAAELAILCDAELNIQIRDENGQTTQFIQMKDTPSDSKILNSRKFSAKNYPNFKKILKTKKRQESSRAPIENFDDLPKERQIENQNLQAKLGNNFEYPIWSPNLWYSYNMYGFQFQNE